MKAKAVSRKSAHARRGTARVGACSMATTYENQVLNETFRREKASQIEWGRQNAPDSSIYELDSEKFARLSTLKSKVADLCDLQPTPASMVRPPRKVSGHSAHASHLPHDSCADAKNGTLRAPPLTTRPDLLALSGGAQGAEEGAHCSIGGRRGEIGPAWRLSEHRLHAHGSVGCDEALCRAVDCSHQRGWRGVAHSAAVWHTWRVRRCHARCEPSPSRSLGRAPFRHSATADVAQYRDARETYAARPAMHVPTTRATSPERTVRPH